MTETSGSASLGLRLSGPLGFYISQVRRYLNLRSSVARTMALYANALTPGAPNGQEARNSFRKCAADVDQFRAELLAYRFLVWFRVLPRESRLKDAAGGLYGLANTPDDFRRIDWEHVRSYRRQVQRALRFPED
jgi:hypothetical protein